MISEAPLSTSTIATTASSKDGGRGGSRGGGGRGSETYSFTLQVIRGRWFSFFASILIMAVAGATYLFGIYSKDIKATLGYDQTTLNLLGFFKDLGAAIGILSGLIAEFAPTWCLLLIGSALNFSGYFMIWLAVTGRIAKPHIWQMCLYMCIAANAQNFENTGVLVTSLRNFPQNRGVVLGLLKGFTGLSGAIMAQIYLAIYGSDAKVLILFIAWLPAAVSIVFVYTIREINSASKANNELRIFYHFLYVSVFLALFVMAMTIAQKLVPFSQVAYAGSASLVCFLLLVPLFITIKEELKLWEKNKQQPVNLPEVKIEILRQEEPSKTSREILEPEKLKEKASCFADIFLNKPERGEDYSILQALLSTDMLILYVATFCGIGTSLTAVDNLGQIGESLGYPRKSIQTFVSLLSIWNYFGRIFAGFVSESLLVKYKFPRPLMLTLALCLSCIGHLLIAFPAPGSVYIASIIIGFSFGAQFPLHFAIVSEIFGLKHFPTLFNCAQLASPLGSYILNVRVTGSFYDGQASKELKRNGLDRSAVKELVCMGSHCYRQSFMILAGVCCFGALVTLILVARTREFYNGDIYKKFKEEAELQS